MTDFAIESTIDFKFTSRNTSGVPTTLSGTPAVEIYEDNSITQITAGITLTADFDSVTGLNNLRVAATAANGYSTNKSYAAVISAGTVGGTSVVGEVIAQFTLQKAYMRGTDNASLASNMGTIGTAAATGDPTSGKTAMAYIKQLVNILAGTAGIATFPAEAAPANGVNFAKVLNAIYNDVTGINGSAMRGTDNAALASVCTAGRLAELDAGNLPLDIAAVKSDTAAVLADTGTDGVAIAAATQNAIADALLDRADAIETGLTLRQALRLTAAAGAGKLSGAATTTVTVRNAVADSKDRITATVDADGNRSAVTTDVT